MALIAKMTCNERTERGGGTYLPLCKAERILDSWPPSNSSSTAIYGHGEGECADCDRLSETVGEPALVGHARSTVIDGKGQEQIVLNAVSSGGGPDDPNGKWAAASPYGKLELTIDNPEAWDYIVPGADYYVEVRRVVPKRAAGADAVNAARR